jgi:hypothetical protein
LSAGAPFFQVSAGPQNTEQVTGANPEPFLLKKAGLKFVNTSALDLRRSWAIRTTSPRTF